MVPKPVATPESLCVIRLSVVKRRQDAWEHASGVMATGFEIRMGKKNLQDMRSRQNQLDTGNCQIERKLERQTVSVASSRFDLVHELALETFCPH